MKCEKCGGLLNENNVCPVCSNDGNENVVVQNNGIENNLVNNVENSVISNNANKKSILDFIKEKKLIFIIAGVVILLLLIVCVVIFSGKDRTKIISNIEENNTLKFTIGEKDFYIGGKISDLKSNDLYYESNSDDSYVESDSVILENFYFDNKVKFLGAIYCGEDKKCSYDNSILLKANFYSKSDVVIDDFIKIGTKYDEIVEKYGEEKGAFYQNSDFLVWSFGKKVGDPYYLLKFENSYVTSSKTVSEIRVGIWWYDGEYEHTVEKVKESEK